MPCRPSTLERVHLLELAEKERPRGFNPIELDGDDPELVTAQFVDTMRDLYFATSRARATARASTCARP